MIAGLINLLSSVNKDNFNRDSLEVYSGRREEEQHIIWPLK